MDFITYYGRLKGVDPDFHMATKDTGYFPNFYFDPEKKHNIKTFAKATKAIMPPVRKMKKDFSDRQTNDPLSLL